MLFDYLVRCLLLCVWRVLRSPHLIFFFPAFCLDAFWRERLFDRPCFQCFKSRWRSNCTILWALKLPFFSLIYWRRWGGCCWCPFLIEQFLFFVPTICTLHSNSRCGTGGGNIGRETEALAVWWLTEEVGTAWMTVSVSVSPACFFRAVLLFLLLRLAAVFFCQDLCHGYWHNRRSRKGESWWRGQTQSEFKRTDTIGWYQHDWSCSLDPRGRTTGLDGHRKQSRDLLLRLFYHGKTESRNGGHWECARRWWNRWTKQSRRESRGKENDLPSVSWVLVIFIVRKSCFYNLGIAG